MTNSISSQNVAPASTTNAAEVREAFTKFVGQTFFAQMIKAMRSTQGKPAYFHGGQAEEVFQSQLDQQLVEAMSESSADRFAGPIFAHQFPQHAAALKAQEAVTSQTP